jgi:uncharacterized membrane protein YedE/YeeE
MRIALSFASGLLFGTGLILGGMTDPAKVQGFLDVFGQWDPSLAFVMAGAIAMAMIGSVRARRFNKAWTGDPIDLPTNRTIDARLLAGGALFGLGWGLGGYCPGPALTALGAGFAPAAWFFVAMLVGMALHDRFLGATFTPARAADA